MDPLVTEQLSVGKTHVSDDGLLLRELALGDFGKGYLQLLAQLTTVGDVSEAQFAARVQELADSPDYRIMVLEDVSKALVVGTATLAVERKFIHACGKVGHIEDVVVDSSCRGKKLGHRLVSAMCSAGQELGCYKVILDCDQDNVPFYEKCGLKVKGAQMARYFD